MSTVTSGRVRAPELSGAGGWINTDGPLTLASLRGRRYCYGDACAAGEGNGGAVGALCEQCLGEGGSRAAGRAFARPQAGPAGALAFPGKAVSDAERIAGADTGHDRVLVCSLDG